MGSSLDPTAAIIVTVVAIVSILVGVVVIGLIVAIIA
jgi:hypothetical protein